MHPSPRNTADTVKPPGRSNSLPLVDGSDSPTTNQGVVYRFEGRVRTAYVTSNVNLAQLDTHSLNAIYALVNGPNDEQEQEQERLAKHATRGTHPSVDTQAVNSEGAVYRNDESRVVSQRRVKSTSSIPKSPVTFSLEIHQHGPPPLPTTRQPVLFYHKHDPYYGFTNFSPYPVNYKGKKYPTSEHLFQSFKVIFLELLTGGTLTTLLIVPRPSSLFSRAHPNVF